MKKLKELLSMAKEGKRRVIAVASAEDADVLEAVYFAKKEGIADPILVGRLEKIEKVAQALDIDCNQFEIIDATDPISSAQIAVKMVRDGACDLLMKGLVKTAELLKIVLDKEMGFRTGRLLSHVFLVEVPRRRRWYAITDGGIVISPSIAEKLQILENALELMHLLGIREPKVAVLAAVETVTYSMPATVDAAMLTVMAARKQIKGAIVDGPLALDVAICSKAAKVKGVKSPVAGKADVLLVPDIEAGNLLGKALVYGCGGVAAGVVMGARRPIVLTSRADSAETKLLSIALGAVLAGRME
ncbi:MAG: bifunctional enoyl-CoA hydratase/phosphate acetyltransferase [Synergistetes bacterium]|nr:bifunctional enoyl-CoA hydratase/phosphate acetyltransferase [Synergistota bacterium]